MTIATILGVPLRFANLENGRTEIATGDYYSQNLTNFDRKAKTRCFADVDEDSYLRNSARFVRAWSDTEQAYLADLVTRVDARLKELGLNVDLPKEIVLVKTTGEEEGGANGYTGAMGSTLTRAHSRSTSSSMSCST